MKRKTRIRLHQRQRAFAHLCAAASGRKHRHAYASNKISSGARRLRSEAGHFCITRICAGAASVAPRDIFAGAPRISALFYIVASTSHNVTAHFSHCCARAACGALRALHRATYRISDRRNTRASRSLRIREKYSSAATLDLPRVFYLLAPAAHHPTAARHHRHTRRLTLLPLTLLPVPHLRNAPQRRTDLRRAPEKHGRRAWRSVRGKATRTRHA